jgi:hypothetical protein
MMAKVFIQMLLTRMEDGLDLFPPRSQLSPKLASLEEPERTAAANAIIFLD